MAKFKRERIFEVIIDSGDDVFKSRCVAKDIPDLKNIYGGNGEFIKITDVTDSHPISNCKVFQALKDAQFGDVECNAIVNLLNRYYANPHE